jgi:hypothetical protein
MDEIYDSNSIVELGEADAATVLPQDACNKGLVWCYEDSRGGKKKQAL